MRRGFPVVALLLLAACAPGEPAGDLTGDTGTSTQTSRKSATPSITREVPPDERRSLGKLTAEQLCGLVAPEELHQLAFEVERGEPRDIGGHPPTRGCSFDSPSAVNSILLGAQPPEYWQIGRDEVELGEVSGTETLHVNDCSVYAPVRGATLQVVVSEPEADTEQCEAAESVAQYALAALVR